MAASWYLKSLFIKSDLLSAIEKILNSATRQELTQIKTRLKKGEPLLELLRSVSGGKHGVSQKELKHVAKDWLGGWWAPAKPEATLRKGLIKTIDLQLQNKKDGHPLPVAMWWHPKSTLFMLEPLASPHQVTVMLVTPPDPTETGTLSRASAGATAKAAGKAAAAKVKQAVKSKAKPR